MERAQSSMVRHTGQCCIYKGILKRIDGKSMLHTYKFFQHSQISRDVAAPLLLASKHCQENTTKHDGKSAGDTVVSFDSAQI